MRGRAAPEWLGGKGAGGGKTQQGPQETPEVGLSRESRRGGAATWTSVTRE